MAEQSFVLVEASATSSLDLRRRFERWIVEHQITENGLCRYYRDGGRAEESALATAYAILLLNGTYPSTADRLIEGLIALQERFASNRHVGGGVPANANGEWLTFYSSDALIATKALMQVYGRSHKLVHLRAATGFVQFVRHLVDGEAADFLAHNLNFPIQYATPDGTYQNWLVPSVGMLFWDALRDYAEAASDASTGELFEHGRRFLLNSAQAENGAYYDHYDPGVPPRRYSPDRWRWSKVKSDRSATGKAGNLMASALGAQRLGDKAGVGRFLQWLKPSDGALYSEIDVATGGSGRDDGEPDNVDVAASAMYRVLLANAGLLEDPQLAVSERPFALGQGIGPPPDLVTGYWVVQAFR